MTRAGEKLYGDWRRAVEADRLIRPSYRIFRTAVYAVALAAIAGAALFGFGG